MSLEFGDVVLVRFPKTDLVGSKGRPAVVASASHYNREMPDVVAMPITGQVRDVDAVRDLVIFD